MIESDAQAIELVKKYEGLRLEAYLCPAGIPTIGYGHTYNVKLGQQISEIQADLYLDHDFEDAEEQVKALVLVPLTPQQLGALTSFVFNLGSGNLRISTLLRKLNSGDYKGAAEQFGAWNKARVSGKMIALSGLTKRRAEEKQLFLA